MKIVFKILFLSFIFLSKVNAIELDSMGSMGEDVYAKKLVCAGVNITFERKKNKSPIFAVNSKQIALEKSCYDSMDCKKYKGADVVMLVNNPACGGNAVEPSYDLYDLQTQKKTSLSFDNADKAKLFK
jgi:hypothetical protein